MSPEQVVCRGLQRAARTLRLEACVDATLAGSASAALTAALGGPPPSAVAAGAIVFAGSALLGMRWWTAPRVAKAIEAADPSFQNVVVTAQEALAGRAIHPVISRELMAQAADRLQGSERLLRGHRLFPRGALATASLAAAALLISRTPLAPPASHGEPSAGVAHTMAAGRALQLRATVIPPAYTKLPVSFVDNPTEVPALEGSTLRLEAPAEQVSLQLVEAGREPQTFGRTDNGARFDLVATTSRVFVIRRANGTSADDERLVQLRVQGDGRPSVVIERPGRDLLFGTPTGAVPIAIAARDDLNVAAISLRYTHIAGSGETFTFEEGELPLRISPVGLATARRATGTLLLDRLRLRDGDTLVYRALVRDDKPGADPVASESFLVEIGKRSEAASGGFSLPEDRDRQGLSQQMLIVKTERLHDGRARLGADAVLEQGRLLAVEQRMIRAEFVFMTGGEVVDEVEEAEHSHELATGRLENAGQVELLNAIREMSRAEARLNAGDTERALEFERAALRALERAFDRRRYFLRTLPERARIDPSRRLSGDTSQARPARLSPSEARSDLKAQNLRDTIAAVSAAVRGQSGLNASLAARIIALDPQSETLQDAAVRLSSNAPVEQKLRAALTAEAELTALLRRRLAAAPAERILRDPLTGFIPGRGQP